MDRSEHVPPDNDTYLDEGATAPGGTEALRLISDLTGLLAWKVDVRSGVLTWLSGAGLGAGIPRLPSLNLYLAINHPDDQETVRAAFSRWLDGEAPLDIQHRILRPDGEVAWLHSRGSVRQPGQDQLLGVAQDITDYRRHQLDAEFLSRLQSFLETAPGDAISLRDIGRQVCEYLDLYAIRFYNVSEADDRLALRAEYVQGDVPETWPGDSHRLSSIITADMTARLAAGQRIAIDDIATDSRLDGNRGYFEEIGLRSILYVPYLSEGRWTMLLCASRKQPGRWWNHEGALLEEVSERTSLRLERSRASLDLHESEERFRSLFEAMDEGFCIIDVLFDDDGAPIDYRFLETNPAFELHTGLHNAQGKRAKELVPNLEEHWVEFYGRVAQTGEPARFVDEAPSMDGRWFDVNAFRVPGNEPHHVAILFTDITSRMQTEQALRESEERVQRALEIESVGIIFFKPDGPVTYANDAFLRMSGYAREDVASGRVRWDTMTPPEWMPNARRAITEFLSLGRIMPYEKQYIRKDGTRWWGLFAAARINEHEGVKFIIDTSATKQVEAERARLADIVEDSNDAILRCEPDGSIIDVNHAAVELYGYSREELLRMNILDTAPPHRQSEFAEKYARLHCGETVPPWETVRYRKDGSEIQVEIRMSPVRDDRGEIVGCSGVVRDVSERKRLEQAQEDFLAMASHDLKSPVTVLLGRAQLMRRRKTYDEASIRTIIDQARRIERLATDLQQVVHIEAGKLTLKPAEVDLGALVREAVERQHLTAPVNNFSLELPEEPVTGLWDRVRLSQVIDNLLGNAVKYSPDGGAITAHLDVTESDVELRITDTGVGISPELQPQLFTRFYRADKEGVSSGLGLGLYISRMLVTAHGGTISMQSELGVGSTFTIRLPRQGTFRDGRYQHPASDHA